MLRSLLLLLVLIFPATAEAQLADCNGADFRAVAQINPNIAFTCVEITQESGSGASVRAIRAGTADAGTTDPYGHEAVGAVLNAYATWDPYATSLGLTLPNITILISDPNNTAVEIKGESFGASFADAQGFGLVGECVIRLSVTASAKDTLDFFATILSHEAFHCVQAASFKDAVQNAGGAQAWWVEGTANFFGELASFSSEDSDKLGIEFVKQIRTTPLTQITYPSYVFFAFLWQQGPEVMGQFFAGLATEPGEEAQQKALIAAVGVPLLNDFAKALVDGTIAMPSGFQFVALPDGQSFAFTKDGTATLPGTPFTVESVGLQFANGGYSVFTGPILFVKDAEGGDWQEQPFQVSLESCSDVKFMKTARFVADEYGTMENVPMNVAQISKCWECNKLPAMDKCLIGTWRMSNDTLLTFLQGKKLAEVNYSGIKGTAALVMNADGTSNWVLEGLSVSADVRPKDWTGVDDFIAIAVEANGIDAGEWSGVDGKAHICVLEDGIEFTTTVDLPLAGSQTFTDTGLAQNMEVAYDCTPTGLSMQYVGPMILGDEAPRWDFERIK